MSTITDWLMVGITFIYVIATILICVANLKSARATQNQLAEMIHEHDENIRLSFMPRLEVNCNKYDPEIHVLPSMIWGFNLHRMGEECEHKVVISSLNIKNIGVNLASSIRIKLEYGDITSKLEALDFANLEICPGQEYHFAISSIIHPSKPKSINNRFTVDEILMSYTKKAKIVLEFDDIQNNHYLQIAHICFSIWNYYEDLTLDKTRDAKIDTNEYKGECLIRIENCFTEPPVFVKKASQV